MAAVIKKPHLPKNYQWAHPIPNHQPLDLSPQLYQDIAKTFLQDEGMVETIRRQYGNRRCVVGLSISNETLVMEVLPTKALYPKTNQYPMSNVLRLTYFLCTPEGLFPLNELETRAIRCSNPDIFTHRLLRDKEIGAINIARTNQQ